MKNESQRSGFTLVEIMIVVAIIGLLAAIAIPSFAKARHESQKSAFINDIRVVTSAFQLYCFENRGRYPANVSPSRQPPEIIPYLPRFNWSNAPTIGGKWDWDYNVSGIEAGVSVRGPSWSDEDMSDIDKAIDDGSLNSGNFQKINLDFTYILE